MYSHIQQDEQLEIEQNANIHSNVHSTAVVAQYWYYLMGENF